MGLNESASTLSETGTRCGRPNHSRVARGEGGHGVVPGEAAATEAGFEHVLVGERLKKIGRFGFTKSVVVRC